MSFPDWDERRFADMSTIPERNADPPDYATGWERVRLPCGCGRGCATRAEHAAHLEAEALLADRADFAEEYSRNQEDPES